MSDVAFIIYLTNEGSSMDKYVFEIHYSNTYFVLIYAIRRGKEMLQVRFVQLGCRGMWNGHLTLVAVLGRDLSTAVC
jgi:hypothetical protein